MRDGRTVGVFSNRYPVALRKSPTVSWACGGRGFIFDVLFSPW